MKAKNNHNIFNVIAVFLLVVILLPVIWSATGKEVVRPLDGAFVKLPSPMISEFTWEKWLNNSFQSEFEKKLNSNIGLHDLLVRLNNQLNWSLFRSISADGVILGKEDQLFEYDYIRAMQGIDYLGEDILDRQIRRMKFLQQELKAKYNTDLIFIFEPSKARYYRNLIPDRYEINSGANTNYSMSVELCEKYQVEYIDMLAWFSAEKDKHPYPLYTKYGIHWSEYGEYMAVDSLVRYFKNHDSYYVPDFEIVRIDESYKPRNTDYDLGYLLNLIHNPKCEKMGYPIAEVTFEKEARKPSVIAVGDSYYFNIMNNKEAQKLFESHKFWYYNKLVYPDQYGQESLVSDLNLKNELANADIVLVTVTERFLYKNLWGFVDDAFAEFGKTTAHEPVYQEINNVLSTDTWLNEIIAMAIQKQVPLHELLLYHADYLAFQTNKEAYILLHGAKYFEESIRTDKKWMQKLQEKATRLDKPIDNVVHDDAMYVFRNNYPDLFEQWTFINNVKSDIFNSPKWLQATKEKANLQFLTLEEMAEIDAIYLWNTRQK